MFGIGRKSISLEDFGTALVSLAQDELGNTAGRSLALRFEDVDLSRGCIPYLESKGITSEQQLLYVRMFTHCSLQGAARNFPPSISKTIVAGAMNGFKQVRLGYDAELQSRELAASYSTNGDVETVALNAVYLVENFIDPVLGLADLFWDDIDGYMTQVDVGIAVAERAASFVQKKYRLD